MIRFCDAETSALKAAVSYANLRSMVVHKRLAAKHSLVIVADCLVPLSYMK